jgi:probable F420-dependent oxidoreductase
MRFGIGQFTLQIPPWDRRDHATLYRDTLDLAALADRLGVDSFWLAEHHGAGDGYNPSLLAFLAAVAARTERIEIGTAVVLAPFHHPLRLAEDAAVVDNISGGRLNLGLGLGWVEAEYRMFGVDFKGRGRRLEEIVEVLRRAWTGERFSFEGGFYRFEDVAVRPRPARRPGPPIYLGGMAPKAVERAARLGDGHYPPSTASPADGVERARAILDERRRAGAAGPYRFGMFIPVGIGADADDGWARIRDGTLHVRGSYMLWGQGQTDVSRARDVAAQVEQQHRAGAVCGSPEDVVEQLRPAVEAIDAMGFADAFVSAILAPPGTPADRAAEAVELYATKVVPALRGD